MIVFVTWHFWYEKGCFKKGMKNTLSLFLFSIICTSTPVRGRIKEGRWVLKKIIPGVIKNNTQWFWCQTISIHQSFFILKQYISIAIITRAQI